MDVKEIRKTIQDLRAAADDTAICENCGTYRRGMTPKWSVLLRRAANLIERLSHTDMFASVMRPQKLISTFSYLSGPPGRVDDEKAFLEAKERLALQIGKGILERANLVQQYDPASMRMVLQASAWIYIPEEAEE